MTAEHKITLQTYGHPANNVVEIVVTDRTGDVVATGRADRRDLGALIADRSDEFAVPVRGWDAVESRATE